MICGDFNARSSLWDQHGTNQQGCALEAALSDVLFTPVTTASPTHHGTRQSDTDSTIDLALVSPKLVPWTRAETLASHGSDHLHVVFSQQKPGIEQKRKLDRTLTEAGSNDGMITELEFTKALSRLSKDTAPGPDRVKYSDIKNLSVQCQTSLLLHFWRKVYALKALFTLELPDFTLFGGSLRLWVTYDRFV